jgi:tripeptide aminopeptidase
MNRLTTNFLKLVQIDSPTGFENEISDFVFQKMEKLGLDTTKDSYGNIIAKLTNEGEPILLTAHLDTVEPGRGIKPVVENGIIKSSGDTILGADNKVALAIIIETIEKLIEEKTSVNIEAVFTLSEEVGNYGAVNLDYSFLNAKKGYSFDSEGKIGTIITASPYYDRFDIKVIGKSAHASQPEDGINALAILNNVLNRINLGKVDGDTLVNIGVIHGGSVRNTILGELEIKGEVRSFIEKNINLNTQKIVETFEEEVKKMNAKAIIDVVRENPGFKFDKDEEIIKNAVKVFEKMKIKPIFNESYGCYDGNIFIGKGIKVLNMCDGSKYSHTVNEQISVENLEKIADVAYNLVLEG